MTTPYVAYEATAGQRDFTVPFPYISRDHVKVAVNGVPRFISEWTSSSVLRLTTAASAGALVEIERATPLDGPLVEFQDGNILTAEDLNIAIRQLLFRQQETASAYDRSLGAAITRIATAGGITGVTGDELLNELATEIADRAVVDDFRARVAQIDLNATNILAIANGDNGAQALVSAEATARIEGDAAEAQSRELLAAKLRDEMFSYALSEQSARVENDRAIATRLNLLGAESETGEAWILDEDRVELSGGVSIATRLSGLDASIGSNSAAIVAEAAARASEIDAVASVVTALETSVDNNTATVSTLQSSVNGLQARYGVTLDVNGYITGFAQNNDGTTGSFVVRADVFSVVSSDGSQTVTPFTVTAEGVEINGNLIVNGSVSTDVLAANAVTQGNSAYTAAAVAVGATWTEVQSCALTATGGDVRVDFCGSYSHLTPGIGDVLYRIKRGAAVVREGTLVSLLGTQAVTVRDTETNAVIGTADVPSAVAGTQAIFAVDTAAPAGAHTYTVELSSTQTGGLIDSRQMALLELKR